MALAPVRETRPVRAAAVVGVSTALGSAVPLLPFIVLPIALAPIVALLDRCPRPRARRDRACAHDRRRDAGEPPPRWS